MSTIRMSASPSFGFDALPDATEPAASAHLDIPRLAGKAVRTPPTNVRQASENDASAPQTDALKVVLSSAMARPQGAPPTNVGKRLRTPPVQNSALLKSLRNCVVATEIRSA